VELTNEDRLRIYSEMSEYASNFIDEVRVNLGIVECETNLKSFNYNEVMARLEKYNKLLHDANSNSIPLISSLRVYFYSVLASTLQKAGFAKEAIEWANKVIQIISQERIRFHFMFRALSHAISIHAANGLWKQFEDDLILLNRFVNTFPIVGELYTNSIKDFPIQSPHIRNPYPQIESTQTVSLELQHQLEPQQNEITNSVNKMENEAPLLDTLLPEYTSIPLLDSEVELPNHQNVYSNMTNQIPDLNIVTNPDLQTIQNHQNTQSNMTNQIQDLNIMTNSELQTTQYLKDNQMGFENLFNI
jgi:hypothetical protein